MDSDKVKAYKARIQTCFRRARVQGFVDWRHIGYLTNGICQILDEARKDLAAPEDRWDLFSVVNLVYLKWGRTPMDDDGETQVVMYEVRDIWVEVVGRLSGEKEEEKALRFFLKYHDGSILDYVESYAYEFMDDHFKSPALLTRKRQFLKGKIREIEEHGTEIDRKYEIPELKGYLLQILSDEGAPIDEVEQYATTFRSYDREDRLLRIYRGRGETDREMALLIHEINHAGWTRERARYEERLKDLYRERGETEAYEKLLKQMFYERPGDEAVYLEYKGRFHTDEWKTEWDRHILPAMKGRSEAMPLFAREERYDLLMDAAEENLDFRGYEKELKKRFPERCIGILSRIADARMEQARDRKGYRKVAAVLRKILKYPDGAKAAGALAEKYRNAYPRRPALLEELLKF